MSRDIERFGNVGDFKTYIDSLAKSITTPIFSNLDKSNYKISGDGPLKYVYDNTSRPASIGHLMFLKYLGDINSITPERTLHNSNTFNFKTNLETIIDDGISSHEDFKDLKAPAKVKLKKAFKGAGVDSLFANKVIRQEIFGINFNASDTSIVYFLLAKYEVETRASNKKLIADVIFESLILTVYDNAEEGGLDLTPGFWDMFKDEAELLAEAAASGNIDTVARMASAVAQNQVVGDGELTAGEYLNYVQCALFADIFAEGYSMTNYPTDVTGRKPGESHYNRRVFPITINGSKGHKPNDFMNHLLYPNSVKSKFSNYDVLKAANKDANITKNRKSLTKTLSFIDVVTDPDSGETFLNETIVDKIQGFTGGGNVTAGSVKQYFSATGTAATQYIKSYVEYTRRKLILVRNGQITNADFKTEFGSDVATITTKLNNILQARDRGIINQGRISEDSPELVNLSIKFNGTNPSMARKDVEVSLQIKLTGLDMMDTVIAGDVDAKDSYTIESLIEFPYVNRKPRAIPVRNHYDPMRNRLRLKVSAVGSGNNSDLIIDLTTIDHSISRDSATGFVTLDVNYRGFFNSVFSMPLMDCLADDTMFNDRINRSKNIKTKLNKYYDNPNATTLEAARDELKNDRTQLEAETGNISGLTILDRLMAKKRFYEYSISDSTIASFEATGFFDYGYVADLKAAGTNLITISPSLVTTNSATGAPATSTPKDIHDMAISGSDEPPDPANQLSGYCVYLGDVVDEFADALYTKASSGYTVYPNHLKKSISIENMFTLLSSIEMFNPVDGDKRAIFNLAQIPIDIGFFSRWFDQTVTKKGVSFLPFQQAVGSLIERLINNTLFEVCLGDAMYNEKPPILRTGFFHDCRKWENVNPTATKPVFNNPLEEVLMNSSYIKEINNDWITKNSIILKRDASFKVSPPKTVDGNAIPSNEGTVYFVAYMQRPSFNFHKVGDSGRGFDDTTPEIHYGRKFTNANFLSNVTFTKTTQPFLRESRFANNSGMTLLSNFYDLDFSFSSNGANTLLYPGTAIDFYLRDWTSAQKWNPHIGGKIPGSTAYRTPSPAQKLGFGGYYIVSSVDYKLGPVPEDFEIKVSTKFIGTDALDGLGIESDTPATVGGATVDTEETDGLEEDIDGDGSSSTPAKTMKEKYDDGELYVLKNEVPTLLNAETLESDARPDIPVLTKNADGTYTPAGSVKKSELE